MKLKTRWLATVSLTTLVLVAAGSLSRASQQMWNPEVAHAAKVTASLLKGKSIRPMFLHRRSYLSSKSIAPLPLPLTHTELASYTLNQPFSLDRSHTILGKPLHPLGSDRNFQNIHSSKPSAAKTNFSSWGSGTFEF